MADDNTPIGDSLTSASEFPSRQIRCTSHPAHCQPISRPEIFKSLPHFFTDGGHLAKESIQLAWIQRQMKLSPRARGLHLITHEVLEAIPEVRNLRVGLLHVFIQHTSASLTINENADGDVRRDLESSLNAIAPEDFPYVHTIEGPD